MIALLVLSTLAGPSASSAVLAWHVEKIHEGGVSTSRPTTLVFNDGAPHIFYSANGATSLAAAIWIAAPSILGPEISLLSEQAGALDALASGGSVYLIYYAPGSGMFFANLQPEGLAARSIFPSSNLFLDASSAFAPGGDLYVASVDHKGTVRVHTSASPFTNWSSDTMSSNGATTIGIGFDAAGLLHVVYERISAPAGHSIKGPTGWTHGSIPNCLSDVTAAVGPDGTIHVACHNAAGLVYGRYDDSAWSMTQVDARGNRYGWEADLAVDAGGTPHIIYRSLVNSNSPDWPTTWALPYYATQAGAVWQIRVIDNTASANGFSASIAIDDRGHPHVSYVTAWTSDTIPGDIGAIDASFDLRYARPVLADLP